MSNKDFSLSRTVASKPVWFHGRYGTVLKSQNHRTAYVSGSGGTVSTRAEDTTALWVEWDDGTQSKLRLLKDSVDALKGHRFCSIDIQGERSTIHDAVRVNLSTSEVSTAVSPFKVAWTLTLSPMNLNLHLLIFVFAIIAPFFVGGVILSVLVWMLLLVFYIPKLFIRFLKILRRQKMITRHLNDAMSHALSDG